MSVHGVGNLVRINGGMDAELYRSILADDLAPSVEHYGSNLKDFIFQHDDDPKHTSRLVRQWLVDNEIEVLDWPAQSPDLNPIENLWEHLKRRMLAPTSMHALWERLELEWNAIQADVCVNLIESMPRRIAAVLKAKEGYTKY
jgi:hypothetical protein